MKSNKKYGNTGVFITLGAAAVMIALGAVLMNGVLAHATGAEEGVGHTAPISQTLGTSDAALSAPENLNIIVYNNGLVPPSDGITAQYAVAIMSEISDRVFGIPVAGRIFVRLGEPYGANEGLYWDIQAEVDDGVVSGTVNATNGVDRNIYHFEISATDWGWFDTWDEETAEQERIEAERVLQEVLARDAAWLAENPQPTEEENRALLQMKRQAMMDFAAAVDSAPYESKAVELVNALGIGDGASAVSAVMRMGNADPGDCTYYVVEVQLDNGKYVFAHLTADSMALLGYERSDISMPEKYYS